MTRLRSTIVSTISLILCLLLCVSGCTAGGRGETTGENTSGTATVVQPEPVHDDGSALAETKYEYPMEDSREGEIYIQLASAKNNYIKAGKSLTYATMIEPEERGFVLTYGLSDREGVSFRQTGTDKFIINKDGSLTLGTIEDEEEKTAATFEEVDPLGLPSWSAGKEGAFRSYKVAGGEQYITAKGGKIVLTEGDGINSTFKITGDQTGVIEGFRGAVYYPTYALNAPQFWKWYDHDIIDRDMRYATDILGINGFRIWVSYEYWLEDSDHFEAAFKDFLDLADAHGIVIMVSLFEGCGDSYTYDGSITWNRIYSGDNASWAVTSPSAAVYNNKNKWSGPKSFVKYFIKTFGNDDRLMAIETYNEPWGNRASLAQYLTEYAVSIQGSVPLTVGTAPADPVNVVYSISAGMDLIQYHDNFPGNTASFTTNAKNRIDQGRLANLPVYCTEVQWVGGPGSINYPSYSNLAPTCNKLMEDGKWAPFYWTLMVHPCYLNSYRNVYHMYNGLINEDGTVNNKKNANTVSDRKSASAAASTVNPYDEGSYKYRYNFSDSFFDLHAYKWSVVNGSWSAESGAYAGSGMTFANDTDFSDFSATFTVNGGGGLVIRAKDKDNCYIAAFDAENRQFVIYKVTKGVKSELARSGKIEGGDPLDVSVTVSAEQIKMFGSCVELTVNDGSFRSGLVGFYAETGAEFDNLRVQFIK